MKKVVVVLVLAFCAVVSFSYFSFKNLEKECEFTYIISNKSRYKFENVKNLGEVASFNDVANYILSPEASGSVVGAKASFKGNLVDINNLIDKLGGIVINKSVKNGVFVFEAYSKKVPFCDIDGKNIEIVYYKGSIVASFPVLFN